MITILIIYNTNFIFTFIFSFNNRMMTRKRKNDDGEKKLNQGPTL